MINYLLDTNICIYIIKKQPIQVIRKLQEHDISEIGISSITLSELEYGVSKSAKREQNKLALAGFLAPIEIVSYDDKAAGVYGDIRAFLEKKGMPIGSLDTLIGAHALSLDCILVTNNTKEFDRIPNLFIEDWTVALKDMGGRIWRDVVELN